MTRIVQSKKEADEMQDIPLSNNTVPRRISAISYAVIDVSNLFLELKKVIGFLFNLTNQLIPPHGEFACICPIYLQ